jgi:hypothetical protein
MESDLLDEENKELGFTNTWILLMVKLSGINRNELCGLDKFICQQCE